MPKAAPFLSSSNAGEFSPRMDARIDFEKYPAAITRGLNLVCLPQGGLTRRPGTRFIKEIKDSASPAALLAFEPVSTQSYMIEAGDQYFRFYRNQGRISVAATTTVITNGNFTSDLTGWTDRSTGSGTTAFSTGRMAISGAGDGFGWTEQAVTVATAYQAVEHVIAFQLSGNPGSHATIHIGTTSLGSDLFSARNMGMGWHVVGFTPGTGTVYFQVINEQPDTLYLDAVSVLSGQPLEIASPYSSADIPSVRPAQSADVQYLFHDDYPPYKMERRGDTSWSLVKVFFQDGPYLTANPDTDLGNAALIKNGRFDGGLANWTASQTGNGYVNFQDASRVILLSSWKDGASTAAIEQSVVTEAPNLVHVVHFQTVGGGTVDFTVGTTSGGTDILDHTGLSAGWYSYSFTPGASPFYVKFNANLAGAAIAPGVTACFCYNATARLLQASAITGSVTVTALADFKPFVATDVGRMLRLEHAGREPGWGIITAFTDSQNVTVKTYRDFASVEPTETWQEGAWSDTTGWPHVGTFYQQRLFAARNALKPQTIWSSQTADFENLRPDAWVEGATTVQDDCALNFTVTSNLNGKGSPPTIFWMIGSRRLVLGTAAGQFAISSKGPALTPSDFSADPQTSVRSLDILPVQIDTVGIFAQRAKRAIYDLGYAFDVDAFKASDVTILSDHITKGNVAQLAYQAEPFSNVWARLDSGTLACLTYKRGQNVVGWTPAASAPSLAGAAVIESIADIIGSDDPSQVYSSLNRDEVWIIVKRTIDGSTKRYIEVMEGFFDGPNKAEYIDINDWKAAVKVAQVDAFYVDCGLTYSGTSTRNISGLDHLEGETVQVLADGAVQSTKTVNGGAITIDRAASKVHVGLGVEWVYRGGMLPYGSPTGQGVGQIKHINKLVFVLRDSGSFQYSVVSEDQVQFKPVPFRLPSDNMGEAIPLFTGQVRVDVDGGRDPDPRVIAKGIDPVPWTLLGITPMIAETQQ